MICQKCHKEISNNAKFCKFCGGESSSVSNSEAGSVDLYFKKRDSSCQVCGALAPLEYVEFNQNIGMLVTREHKYIKGNFCKNCIKKNFWSFTLVTIAVGWLGVISMIVAPVFILGNIFYYIKASIKLSE